MHIEMLKEHLARLRKEPAPPALTHALSEMIDRTMQHIELQTQLAAADLWYNGYRIVVKRDFGSQPFRIDGMPCMWGYVVGGDGRGGSSPGNAMPGATWFQTVEDAKLAIDILTIAGGDADKFWAAWNNWRDARRHNPPLIIAPPTKESSAERVQRQLVEDSYRAGVNVEYRVKNPDKENNWSLRDHEVHGDDPFNWASYDYRVQPVTVEPRVPRNPSEAERASVVYQNSLTNAFENGEAIEYKTTHGRDVWRDANYEIRARGFRWEKNSYRLKEKTPKPPKIEARMVKDLTEAQLEVHDAHCLSLAIEMRSHRGGDWHAANGHIRESGFDWSLRDYRVKP